MEKKKKLRPPVSQQTQPLGVHLGRVEGKDVHLRLHAAGSGSGADAGGREGEARARDAHRELCPGSGGGGWLQLE